jgi:hypothetical protein
MPLLLTEAVTILLLLANWSSDKEHLLSLVYLSNAPFGALTPFGYKVCLDQLPSSPGLAPPSSPGKNRQSKQSYLFGFCLVMFSLFPLH